MARYVIGMDKEWGRPAEEDDYCQPACEQTLTEAILGLLNGSSTGLTYNQVANALGVPYTQASAVLKCLAESPLSPVYHRAINRSVRKHAEYFFAPQRKQIDACRSSTDRIVQEVILELLWDRDASESIIRQHCAKVLLSISIPIVRQSLANLRASAQVKTRPGPHSAVIYSLA